MWREPDPWLRYDQSPIALPTTSQNAVTTVHGLSDARSVAAHRSAVVSSAMATVPRRDRRSCARRLAIRIRSARCSAAESGRREGSRKVRILYNPHLDNDLSP